MNPLTLLEYWSFDCAELMWLSELVTSRTCDVLMISILSRLSRTLKLARALKLFKFYIAFCLPNLSFIVRTLDHWLPLFQQLQGFLTLGLDIIVAITSQREPERNLLPFSNTFLPYQI